MINIVTIFTYTLFLLSCYVDTTSNIVEIPINSNFRNYSSIEIGANINSNISNSDNFSLKITAPENLIPYIVYKQDGSTLKIYIKNSTVFENSNVTTTISLPAINSVKLGINSGLNVKGFKCGSFNIQ